MLKTVHKVHLLSTDQTWTRLSQVPVISWWPIVLIPMISCPAPTLRTSISSNSVIVVVEHCFQSKMYPSPVPQQSISLLSPSWVIHMAQVMGSQAFRVWLGLWSSTLFCKFHNRNPSKPVNLKYLLGHRMIAYLHLQEDHQSPKWPSIIWRLGERKSDLPNCTCSLTWRVISSCYGQCSSCPARSTIYLSWVARIHFCCCVIILHPSSLLCALC